VKVLIVDDEAPARSKLLDLLGGEADITVVGEAENGRQAVEAIREHRPDVVFLDVQMPQLDGFGVVAEVGVEHMPLVVFVTAFDEHALQAFEVHALDYLLKPFAAQRFRTVLARVRQRLRERDAGGLQDRFGHLLEELGRHPRFLQQLLVEREAGREVLVAVSGIDRMRSERNYVRVFTLDGAFRVRGTLTELEERLDPGAFLRINRSEIVRLGAVAELQPWFHGDYRMVLTNGTVLTWSRRYRARSKSAFTLGS